MLAFVWPITPRPKSLTITLENPLLLLSCTNNDGFRQTKCFAHRRHGQTLPEKARSSPAGWSLWPEADSKLYEIHSGKPSSDSDQVSESGGGALNYGFVSIMGRRRVMENAVTVVPPGRLAGKYSCFAVYDGHGGAMEAKTCGHRLHKCLETHIERTKKLPVERDFEWGKVMVDCFGGADDEEFWHEVEEREGSSAAVLRFTAMVVVVVGKEEVVVVNFGNSKAVLCRGGLAVPLSSDLKGERADEKVRADDDDEAVQGRTINWNACYLSPLSTTSTSLGGEYRKQYIITEPKVTVTKRTEQSDDFLIIATNSLWNVVGDKTACEVVKRYCMNGELWRSSSDGSSASAASEAAAALTVLAMAKGSRHNISIIVVQLK
ncbi:UNVERIFIED_CONTAM: putative protein phosphatase 2C 8 [Sesamum radiatum]|uniref:PPM-type phosphatase domain-containing protein n=1 Tax=Sesamum radiatum TaxID=300843 RepID=A0AAW2TSW5_SESRA